MVAKAWGVKNPISTRSESARKKTRYGFTKPQKKYATIFLPYISLSLETISNATATVDPCISDILSATTLHTQGLPVTN